MAIYAQLGWREGRCTRRAGAAPQKTLDSSNYLGTRVLHCAADGTQLFTQSWRPAGGARDGVAILYSLAKQLLRASGGKSYRS